MSRTRIALSALSLIALLPTSSSAMDLRWSTGSYDLSFETATRCTLMVRADGEETTLPDSWRLVWIAEGCSIRPVPMAPGDSCAPGVAGITSVGGPEDAAGALAHVLPAWHSLPPGEPVLAAQYVFDLPEGSRGKLRVVALDPTDPDSTGVIESPVATFNGGLEDPFPPVALRAVTTHRSTTFEMSVVGAGLENTGQVSLVDASGGWQQPVGVSSRSDTQIQVVGSFAAAIPAAIVALEGGEGIAAATLPADQPPPPLDPQTSTCQDRYVEQRPGFLQNEIQPRDFAIVPGGWTPSGAWSVHMFYGRMNLITRAGSGEAFTEKNFGHVATRNMLYWPGTDSTVSDTMAHFDTTSVVSSAHGFDNGHVYAPCVVQDGLTYNMFYAGEDSVGNQAIGLATSTDLVTWNQQVAPVFTWDPNGRNVVGSWATPKGLPGVPAAQLRDPYVIRDPDTPGGWLLYYVTVPQEFPNSLVVGVSHSRGNTLTAWDGGVPLFATLHPRPAPGEALTESPSVFQYQGRWWIFYTPSQTGQVYGVANANSPSDTVVAHWSPPDSLDGLIVDYVTHSPSGDYGRWHAMEYLAIAGGAAYIAGWDDLNVSIDYVSVEPWQQPALFTERCPISNTGVPPLSVGPLRFPRLTLIGANPASGTVTMAASLAHRALATLSVYSVAGRKVATIFNGLLPAGTSTLTWTGSGSNGGRLGQGVYFISMATDGVRRSVRAVWLP